MNFNKTLKYVTDRPFLMALIIFVIFFLAYNFFFKNKSAAATTVASAALPTSGRATIYNQEFQQYPVGTPVPPQPVTPPTSAPTITTKGGETFSSLAAQNQYGWDATKIQQESFFKYPWLATFGRDSTLPANLTLVVGPGTVSIGRGGRFR